MGFGPTDQRTPRDPLAQAFSAASKSPQHIPSSLSCAACHGAAMPCPCGGVLHRIQSEGGAAVCSAGSKCTERTR
jgi:hypothetical protein